jgi:sugar lactone lactonase YvrE
MLERFDELVTGLDHPEGVTWGVEGRIYAGGEAGQIYSVGLDGSLETRGTTGGFIYGLALDGRGNVYACDMGRAEVVRMDPTGAVETYSSGTPERPLRVPNWAAFDDVGNLYVTDSGEWGSDDGVIFKVEPGGRTGVWTTALPRFPNGLCLTSRGDSLYVIESRGRAIWRVPILEDGAAGAPEPFAELPGSQPDGVAIDSQGIVYVGCYRPDRIYRITPQGEAEVLAEDPDGVVLNQPANLAFVGPRLDRLVVSSLGGWSLMIADVEAAGASLRYPRLAS